MKVVFCWSDISGYMAAGWRALAAMPSVDLSVLAFAPRVRGGQAPFDAAALMAGLNHRLLDETERNDPILVRDWVRDQKPDAVVMTGWFHQPFVKLTSDPALHNVRFYMGMDTGWRGELRQHLARYRLHNYLRRLSGVMVAGERAWQYAKRLGFAEQNIRRGIYPCDYDAFTQAYESRRASGIYPRKFLFVGRYAPEKGLDILIDAYHGYRQSVENPWPLTCCGTGPLANQLRDVDGLTDRGFIQPADQPAIFAEHGVFVLPSLYEPWGVVIAEAMASGLPVICTEACGAGVELVRSYYTGMKVATGSAAALRASMLWFHHHSDQMADFAYRGNIVAGGYAAQVWADNWLNLFTAIID